MTRLVLNSNNNRNTTGRKNCKIPRKQKSSRLVVSSVPTRPVSRQMDPFLLLMMVFLEVPVLFLVPPLMLVLIVHHIITIHNIPLLALTIMTIMHLLLMLLLPLFLLLLLLLGTITLVAIIIIININININIRIVAKHFRMMSLLLLGPIIRLFPLLRLVPLHLFMNIPSNHRNDGDYNFNYKAQHTKRIQIIIPNHYFDGTN
jgi:hypothetical protein